MGFRSLVASLERNQQPWLPWRRTRRAYRRTLERTWERSTPTSFPQSIWSDGAANCGNDSALVPPGPYGFLGGSGCRVGSSGRLGLGGLGGNGCRGGSGFRGIATAPKRKQRLCALEVSTLFVSKTEAILRLSQLKVCEARSDRFLVDC